MLLLAVLAPATAVAQQAPQPLFTELFTSDPVVPSQLLKKWRISSQLDSKLQPLRVGVVGDPIGKTVGRITVQEGDGLDGASEAMLQARRYVCDSKGSRAAAMEAELGGVVRWQVEGQRNILIHQRLPPLVAVLLRAEGIMPHIHLSGYFRLVARANEVIE